MKVEKRFRYTAEHLEFLREGYKTLSRIDLSAAFNERFGLDRTVCQTTAALKNHKFKSGRTGHHAPGSRPWNAGTVGIMKANSGTFKKGNVPVLVNPIGHERICTVEGYVKIKVDAINPYTGNHDWYRNKHVVLWEAANGPVPKGYVVSFRDGDKMNLAIENLELLSRSELCRMNKRGVYKLPPEIVPTAKLLVKLDMKIFEASK